MKAYGGSRTVDLYYGDTLLWSDVKNHVGESKTLRFSEVCDHPNGLTGSNRYQERFAMLYARLFKEYEGSGNPNGFGTKSYRLWLYYDYLDKKVFPGIEFYQYYDPYFFHSAWRGDEYLYSANNYWDACYTYGIANAQYILKTGRVHPVLSRVSEYGAGTWAYATRRHMTGIQGIHYMNKYGDSNTVVYCKYIGCEYYGYPLTYFEHGLYDHKNWDGWGDLSNGVYATIHTAQMLMAMSHYAYWSNGADHSWEYANQMANVLLACQIPQNGEIQVIDYNGYSGIVTRPNEVGGFIRGYYVENGVVKFKPPVEATDKWKFWLQMIGWWLDCPAETMAEPLANAEITAFAVQALRTYYRLKYGYSSEDLEHVSELGGFRAAHGLWHVTTHRAYSGTHSFYYGREGDWDYDVGTTKGDLELEPFIIRKDASKTAYLQFRTWWQTEAASTYDLKKVYISTDYGETWTCILTLPGGSSNGWQLKEVNIGSYEGKVVMFKFEFDSRDGVLNDYEGWYIDDIRVIFK